jgi:hypothetical protein
MRSILLEIIHVVYLNASVLQPKERIDRRTHKETDTVLTTIILHLLTSVMLEMFTHNKIKLGETKD